jgi:glycosyltransferase involved in cell wall biosynthesis
MVIKSIIDVLNPHHFIVVDRFSNDDTQETLKRYASTVLKLIEERLSTHYVQEKLKDMLSSVWLNSLEGV